MIKKTVVSSTTDEKSIATERKILETQHPNIVGLVEYIASEDGIEHFFVLEKLQMDLFSFITPSQGDRPLSEPQARLVFRDVTSALQHLHA